MSNGINKTYIVVNVDNGDTFIYHGSKYLSSHFQVYEFASPDSTVILISFELVKKLEYLRVECGCALSLYNAFRTIEFNKKLGGHENSHHQHGRAVDIKVPKIMTVEQLYKKCEYIFGYDSGIGEYTDAVHVDIHNDHDRWSDKTGG